MQQAQTPYPYGGRAANTRIDIPYLCRALFRNLILILLCGWIGGLWGLLLSIHLQKPTYSSSAYMLIVNKEDPDSFLSDATISKIAAQYQKTFTSTVMKSTVKELLEEDQLKVSLSAAVGTGTNVMVVRATAQSPLEAFSIVRTAIDNYTSVTNYVITDYTLEEIMSPTVPTWSNNSLSKFRMALLGAFAGLALSAGLIALVCLLREDVKNEEQLTQEVDGAHFATLYYERKPRKDKKRAVLISFPSTSFLYTENIRKMATTFDYRAKKEGTRILLITSVEENEGKSTVAANLALALSQQGKKVLLVDGDLRKPSLHKIFEKTIQPEMEIGEYLNGRKSLQDVLTRDKDNDLYYIFGTRAYRNSDIMLASEEMQELFQTARAHMDYIIIDTAPTGITSDAEILCKFADNCLLVVRQGTSRIPVINDTLDKLRSQSQVMGIIFNNVQTGILPGMTEYGYHYGVNYGYGYGYGRYRKRGEYGGYGKKRKKQQL